MKLKSVLLCLCFALATLSVFARSPAVEPVTGISIDQYQEVSPSKDPGYNWNQGNSAASTSLITTRVPSQRGLIQGTSSQGKSLGTTLFLIALLTLPFISWNLAMKSLEKKKSASLEPAPTVDLNSEREKRSQKDTQESDRKAS